MSNERRWRPGGLAGAMIVALAACSGADEGPDAEGIYGAWTADTLRLADTTVIRTISGSVWGDTMVLVPEVEIGVLDGPNEYVFGSIDGLDVGPDGNVWVVDGQADELRVFTPDGEHVRTIGRSGQGPGEFSGPDAVRIRSDGVAIVRDFANARLGLFDPDGGYGGQIPLQTAAVVVGSPLFLDREDRIRLPVVRVDPDRGLVGDPLVARYDAAGERADTVTVPHPDVEPGVVTASNPEGAGFYSSRVPFWPGVAWTLDPDDRFIFGRGDAYRLDIVTDAGPALRIERAAEPADVPPEEASARYDQVAEAMRRIEPSWSWNGPEVPDSKPYFQRLLVGADETLWVYRHTVGVETPNPFFDPDDPSLGPPTQWVEPAVMDVFDLEGRYLGPVKLPDELGRFLRRATIRPTTEEVWAPRLHDLGHPQVVRYRLEPQGGAE